MKTNEKDTKSNKYSKIKRTKILLNKNPNRKI